jgi:hypothetical protein
LKEFQKNLDFKISEQNWKTDEFLSIQDTLARFILEADNQIGDEEQRLLHAKAMLIAFLHDGLIRSVAQFGYCEWAICDEDRAWETFEIFEKWLKHETYVRGGRGRIDGPLEILPRFWMADDVLSKGNWIGRVGGFDVAKRAEWEKSIFHQAETHFLTQRFPAPASRVSFYGIRLVKADIEVVCPAPLPNASEPVQITTRGTKFDWEGAFADVGAWLYADADFPDLDATGVQKLIVDELRLSFEKRGLDVPELTSLKNKARKILGALRAK